MNILVTGANGQLGNELRVQRTSSADRFVFTDVNEVPGLDTVFLDITDPEAIRRICASENIDVIVNCAAYTNVDKAEEDAAVADLLNHLAPKYLAEAACESGAALIHISTDYVFPGTGCTPLTERDAPDPRSVYGRTKLAGEQAVVESGCRYMILRTAWLYSPFGRNFVKTMMRLTAERDSLQVVCDQVGTPTYAADLAAAILHVISTRQLDRTGIYHYSDAGAISWYDFAQEICALAGNECRISPCLSADFPSKVDRPHYSVLDKTLVQTTFGVSVPYWKDSLKDCMNRLK